jgi:hypothetical protein
MAGSTTKVEFDIFARDRGASPVFDKFGRKVRSTADDIHFLSSATKGLLAGFASYASISAATNFLKESNAEARESQKVNALTANLVRQRGDAERLTALDVSALATAVSNKTAIDDEAIQSAENLILTFHKVRNEVGAGNDIFDRATRATADLAGVPGMGGLQSSAKVLGKALQDPLRGITALGRAGVQFTDSQKKQIKAFVEQNDLLGAQKIILKEVESQVKGSAEAQATAGDKLTVAYKNAQETIGTALLPVVDELADSLADKAGPAAENLASFLTDDGIPAVKGFVTEARPIAEDVLPAIADTGKVVIDVLKVVAPLVGDVADGFADLPAAGQQAILLGAGVALLSRRLDGFKSSAGNAILDLRTMPTEMRNATLKTAALRTGVGAAGVGLSLFADDLGKSHKELGQTATVLGSAATGFALGGPWGAAVGAGIGIISAFGDANHHAVADVDELSDSLSDQSGQLTENTKLLVQNALEKDGAFKRARQLGVNLGDVTDAASGDKAALARIRAQRAASAAAVAAAAEAQSPGAGRAQGAAVKRQFDELTDSIGAQNGALQDAKDKWDNLNDSARQSKSLNALTAAQIRDVTKATDGLPKSVITQFTQPGYEKAVENVANIATKYNLTPKQVETALKALDYTKPQIAAVKKRMAELDRLKANPKVNISGNALSQARAIGTAIKDIHGKTVGIKVVGGTQLAGSYVGGRLPDGFAGGGRVPGTPPVDPTKDNVLGIGPSGKMIRVRSREWIINEQQSEKNDRWLRAINNGLNIDDMLSGETGIADTSRGPAARVAGSPGVSGADYAGAIGQLMQAIEALRDLEVQVTFGVDQRTAAKIVQKGTAAQVRLK